MHLTPVYDTLSTTPMQAKRPSGDDEDSDEDDSDDEDAPLPGIIFVCMHACGQPLGAEGLHTSVRQRTPFSAFLTEFSVTSNDQESWMRKTIMRMVWTRKRTTRTMNA